MTTEPKQQQGMMFEEWWASFDGRGCMWNREWTEAGWNAREPELTKLRAEVEEFSYEYKKVIEERDTLKAKVEDALRYEQAYVDRAERAGAKVEQWQSLARQLAEAVGFLQLTKNSESYDDSHALEMVTTVGRLRDISEALKAVRTATQQQQEKP